MNVLVLWDYFNYSALEVLGFWGGAGSLNSVLLLLIIPVYKAVCWGPGAECLDSGAELAPWTQSHYYPLSCFPRQCAGVLGRSWLSGHSLIISHHPFVFQGGVLGFWGGVGSLGTVFLLILLSKKYCCLSNEVSKVLHIQYCSLNIVF